MGRYVVRRVAASIVLLLCISVLAFTLLHLAPGDPFANTDSRRPGRDVARLRHVFDLDAPVPIQYARWLGNVIRGDFGTSLATGEPVRDMIAARLPATLALMGTALLLAVVLGLAAGTSAALRQNTIVDHAIGVASLVGLSVPVFWLGVLSIVVFSIHLHWLPPGGTTEPHPSLPAQLRQMVLPVGVLTVAQVPLWTRTMRSSVLETLSQEYLRGARARGLPEWRIVARHVVRPSLGPIVTLLGLELPGLVMGAAITESVFAWPGVGRLFYDGVERYDYPRLMGILLIASTGVVAGNLIADLLNARLDTRIALGSAR